MTIGDMARAELAKTQPGSGTIVTIIDEALAAAVDEWMEMAPQSIADTLEMIHSEFGEEAVRRDIADIISSALMGYHCALHEMQGPGARRHG